MHWMAMIMSLGLVVASLGGCEKQPSETKDRLTPEAMEAMVEGPIDTVRKQGLAGGQASFEELLTASEDRYGTDSVQIADLLTSFGVGLYVQGYEDDNPAVSRASLRYLRESIAQYRKAFSPEHPEVAVALHSFADADIALKGHLTREAEVALNEALRIRRAALGSDNLETRATVDRLARARRMKCSLEPVGSAARTVCEAESAVSK